jgi:hypothetical protein
MVRIKILSNFDTWLWKVLFAGYEERYWVWKVLFVRRGYIYVLFRVIFPAIVLVMILIPLVYFLIHRKTYELFILLLVWVYIIWASFIWLALLFQIIRSLINYHMDYTIITPKQIISFDQTWILNRKSRAIEIEKIKSISVDKKWLLKSIFNYGWIVFFAEWDSQYGDLTLNYILDPLLLRDKIAKIMKIGG